MWAKPFNGSDEPYIGPNLIQADKHCLNLTDTYLPVASEPLSYLTRALTWAKPYEYICRALHMPLHSIRAQSPEWTLQYTWRYACCYDPYNLNTSRFKRMAICSIRIDYANYITYHQVPSTQNARLGTLNNPQNGYSDSDIKVSDSAIPHIIFL